MGSHTIIVILSEARNLHFFVVVAASSHGDVFSLSLWERAGVREETINGWVQSSHDQDAQDP